MKIRMGFVSNSSSSSFIAVGALFPTSDLEGVLQKLGIEFDEDEFEYEKNGLTLIRGYGENGIEKGSFLVASDYLVADECGEFEEKKIPFSEAKAKLLAVGIENDPIIITGSMAT